MTEDLSHLEVAEDKPDESLLTLESIGKFDRVAQPGEYLLRLKSSGFRNSRVLALAAEYVETGKFEEGLVRVETEIRRRGIMLKHRTTDDHTRGTLRANGKETIILGKDYAKGSALRKLMELTHKNMSLVLQRSGEWENPHSMIQLLLLDISFAQTARLGALKISDPAQRKAAIYDAIEHESQARIKIHGIKEDMEVQKSYS